MRNSYALEVVSGNADRLGGVNPTPTPSPSESLAPLVGALAPYTDFISAFAAIITAVIAVVALASTARDSRDRSRPLVMAVFRMAEHSESAFELVVRNYGSSAARDLEVSFDPPLTADDRQEDLTNIVAKRYDEAIELLPPGSELSNTWWRGKNTGGRELVNGLNTPEEVSVLVSYKGNRIRRYKDTFRLSADIIKLTTYSVSSTSAPGRMKTIAESMKSIANELKSTNRQLRDIGRRLPLESGDGDGRTISQHPRASRGVHGLFARLRRQQ